MRPPRRRPGPAAALEEGATLRQEFIPLSGGGQRPGSGGDPPPGRRTACRRCGRPRPRGPRLLPRRRQRRARLGWGDVGRVIPKPPEHRLPVLALAVVAIGAGTTWPRRTHPGATHPPWPFGLGFLAAAGHELIEAETQLMDEARRSLDGDGEVADPCHRQPSQDRPDR